VLAAFDDQAQLLVDLWPFEISLKLKNQLNANYTGNSINLINKPVDACTLSA
jgi:hypothetical protein